MFKNYNYQLHHIFPAPLNNCAVHMEHCSLPKKQNILTMAANNRGSKKGTLLLPAKVPTKMYCTTKGRTQTK
jgi:hypothetical protein